MNSKSSKSSPEVGQFSTVTVTSSWSLSGNGSNRRSVPFSKTALRVRVMIFSCEWNSTEEEYTPSRVRGLKNGVCLLMPGRALQERIQDHISVEQHTHQPSFLHCSFFDNRFHLFITGRLLCL